MGIWLAQHYQKEGFGEQLYHGATTLHPIGLLMIIALFALTLSVKRSKAVYPIILAALFMPAAQRLVIAGADFSVLRLMVLAGMIRVFARNETASFKWIKLDSLVTAWSLVSTLAFIVLWGSMGQLIFRVGQLYDVLGMYLYFRVVIRTWGDVDGAVKFTVKLLPLLVVIFFLEKTSGKNQFHFLGAQEWAAVREGRIRVQGAFPHAILAGTYFAALLPMAAVRYFRPGGKMGAIRAFVLIMVLVFMCASSTPLVGVMAGCIGVVMWSFRFRMGSVRMGVVMTLFALHLVMKKPVWHLIARLSFSGGNTSYHRYFLIDNSIRYFFDWALMGLKDTAYWGHAQGDVTNQYIIEGVRGGFLALVFFCWALAEAFSQVGKLWRRVRRNKTKRTMAWGMGVALFAQCLMFLSISISHSQQNMSMFFFILASIGSLSLVDNKPRRKRKGPRQSTGSPEETSDELQEQAA